MKTTHLLATLLVLPFALATAADEPAKPKRDPAHLFKLMDHDGDGGVTLDEYKASTVGQIDPSRVGDVFKKKDSDGDGKLSLTEFMYVPPREVPKPTAAAEGKKEKKKEKTAAKEAAPAEKQ